MIKEKIAYIPGYNDSPNDVSFNILSKYVNKNYELVAIDYDEENVDIDSLKSELKSLGIYKVIGLSLGGFIALNLGNEFKKMVFNPCMKPSVELPKLGVPEKMVAKYTSIENDFFSNLQGNKLDKATTCGFFSDFDELFGPHGYKFRFKSYYRHAYNLKCGHQIEDSAIKKIAYRIKMFFDFENVSIVFKVIDRNLCLK